MELNHSQLERFLIMSAEKSPVLVLSQPGIGKSYKVKQAHSKLAAKQGRQFKEWNRLAFEEKLELIKNAKYIKDTYIFCDVRLSQWDAGDFAIPDMSDKSFYQKKSPMMFAALSQPEASGVFFADELPNALPIVQAAAQQLFLDGAVGEVTLSPKVSRVAAGNRGCDRCNVFELSAATCNRFGHVELVKPTVDSWLTEFAYRNGIDERISSFLLSMPDRLTATDAEVKDSKNLAFPSPRAWTNASELAMGTNDADAFLAVAAWCGEGTARQFKGYLDVVGKIDIRELMANPDAVLSRYANGGDGQILYGMISAVTSAVNDDAKRIQDGLGVVVSFQKHKKHEWANALFQSLMFSSSIRKKTTKERVGMVCVDPEKRKSLEGMMKFLVDTED